MLIAIVLNKPLSEAHGRPYACSSIVCKVSSPNFTVRIMAWFSALILSKRCFFDVSTLALLASWSSTSSPWGPVGAACLRVEGTCANTSGVCGTSEGIAADEEAIAASAWTCCCPTSSSASSKTPMEFAHLGWTDSSTTCGFSGMGCLSCKVISVISVSSRTSSGVFFSLLLHPHRRKEGSIAPFFCPSSLPFGGSTVLSFTHGPAGNRSTTGTLSTPQEWRHTHWAVRATGLGFIVPIRPLKLANKAPFCALVGTILPPNPVLHSKTRNWNSCRMGKWPFYTVQIRLMLRVKIRPCPSNSK